MRVLLTGYKGFIGQNMARYLKEGGVLVQGYEWGDRDYSLDNIDVVIHLGAISDTTTTNTHQLLIQNYYFTVDLVKRCVNGGIPIQIASSASVYGTDNNTFRETDIPAPKNHYAWSKLMVEEYCGNLKSSTPIQVFRYFNVYGPHEEHKGSQASPHTQFRLQAQHTGEVKVFEGSENFKRDFIHVDTICGWHTRFFSIKKSGIWNFGTGTSTSFYDVAQSIATQYGSKIVTIPMPEKLKPSYQTYTQANPDKLLNTLNP